MRWPRQALACLEASGQNPYYADPVGRRHPKRDVFGGPHDELQPRTYANALGETSQHD